MHELEEFLYKETENFADKLIKMKENLSEFDYECWILGFQTVILGKLTSSVAPEFLIKNQMKLMEKHFIKATKLYKN